MNVLCALILAYITIMALRMVMTFFPPPRHGSPFATLQHVVVDLTEPVLLPMRRLMPSAGPIDLSFVVVLLVLFIVFGALCEP